MLTCLRLRNYIFIDDLEIDFKKKLTILTGETGSGKSIIIGAINLLFGEKIDKQIIKKGKNFCEISASLEIDFDFFREKLELFNENFSSKEDLEEIIISRKITDSNKSKFYINGQLVNVSIMKEFLSGIIEIHGQNSNQKIFSAQTQLNILDRFSKNAKILSEIEHFYNLKLKIENRLEEIIEEKRQLKDKKEFLKFQFDELSKIDFKIGEDLELEIEYKKLTNVDTIKQILSDISMKSETISKNIFGLQKDFEKLKNYNNEYSEFENEINNSYDMFSEIENRIISYKGSLEINDYQLDNIADKLDKISKLKKKYQMDLSALLDYREKIKTDLNKIDFETDEEIELNEKLQEVSKILEEKCFEIHNIREKFAVELENLINENFQELYMPKVVMKITVDIDKNEKNERFVFSKTGFDKVKFLIRTNPGQDFAELKNTVSGGELSRIMLAIKYVLSNFDRTGTLIFDEIDTGISGKTSFVVGKKLKNIGKEHQVICITHQAQVAIFGDNNKLINKKSNDDFVEIEILDLDRIGKIKEVARMLGGINITDTVLKNAEELVISAE